MDPIISFLRNGTLPYDATTSICIQHMVANFILIRDELYKKAFVGPYLKCLPQFEADYTLRKVHSKICGEHLEPLAKITEANAKQFVWKNIICCFGLTAKIITDNETQFTGRVFTSFCKDLHIQLVHTALAHPQTNGQKEVTNRTVLKGLKTRLEKVGGQWVEELHNVL
ncbi:uncharacterized protein LOC110026122 [Phalaenopsis equestris]|uniref:uncharacterized protein LOC110026122 n=1 Tax=Phalaenopsis equestris TaxID=78828 RepID=UPI0009E5972A|nr:uncharacterized protein LOC110026122 [Phalaenopsis equestris]